MTSYRISPLAADDLENIWLHIAEDHSAYADRFLDRLEKVFSLLATTPSMGREYQESELVLRRFPVGDYLLFYRIHPKDNRVDIVRILHASRDPDTHLI